MTHTSGSVSRRLGKGARSGIPSTGGNNTVPSGGKTLTFLSQCSRPHGHSDHTVNRHYQEGSEMLSLIHWDAKAQNTALMNYIHYAYGTYTRFFKS